MGAGWLWQWGENFVYSACTLCGWKISVVPIDCLWKEVAQSQWTGFPFLRLCQFYMVINPYPYWSLFSKCLFKLSCLSNSMSLLINYDSCCIISVTILMLSKSLGSQLAWSVQIVWGFHVYMLKACPKDAECLKECKNLWIISGRMFARWGRIITKLMVLNLIILLLLMENILQLSGPAVWRIK